MSVIVSRAFRDQMVGGGLANHVRLQDLARRLEAITPQSLRSDPSIRRLSGTEEEMYVLRFHGLRVFLAVTGDDVIVLRAMEHG